jgi:ubiquinone/menaquinone biosynthesis C-methylase UbiE
MTAPDSKQRFSDRVDDYVKFRPTYPAEVLQLFKSKFGLKPSDIVVDVGSGTGISAELFLKNGNEVYAVEPNAAMRTAAEKTLSTYPKLHSLNGNSEATTLPAKIADFVIAAQAFHWFSPEPTKKEFQRILKNDGYAVIIFNDRKVMGSPFAEKYEALLNEFGTDYKQIKHRNISEQRYIDFLGRYEEFNFPNFQIFDFAGALGRTNSSSYMPKQDDPRYPAMKAKLEQIFSECQKDGFVTMEYTTQVFAGQINRP